MNLNSIVVSAAFVIVIVYIVIVIVYICELIRINELSFFFVLSLV